MLFQTNEEAQMNCRQLQVLLGLQDWEVACELVDSLDHSARMAEVLYQVKKKMATISILKSGDNHLRSLLHELIHLMLAWMDPLMKKNPLADILLEQTVHAFSLTCLNLLAAAKQQIPKESISSGPEA
jgi:hypothetical protein